MDTRDIYVDQTVPADHVDDTPFEPLAPEFIAHTRAVLGRRVDPLVGLRLEHIESSVHENVAEFTNLLGVIENPGERVITAAVILVALHDAIIASLPLESIPQILQLVGHDPRTLEAVTSCETLVPESAL